MDKPGRAFGLKKHHLKFFGAGKAGLARLALAGIAVVGIGGAATSALWTDVVTFGGAASAKAGIYHLSLLTAAPVRPCRRTQRPTTRPPHHMDGRSWVTVAR